MNRFYFLHLLFFLTLFFKSCSSKPEPVPITKKKIRVPSWVNGISSDYKKWYGVGQSTISDSTKPENLASSIIIDQILLDIKTKLNNGFDLENLYLDSIAKKIIDSRSAVIKSLTKVDSVFNNNGIKYALASIDKDIYYAKIEDKLNSYGLEGKLDQIENDFSDQTFITLSSIVKIVVENFDLISENKNNQYLHFNTFKKLKMILSNFNNRIDFSFTPNSLKGLPIINRGQNLYLTIIDTASSQNLNGINFSFKIDFDKMISGNYSRIFDLKPKEFNILVLPFGVKLFLKGSITSLGSGIDKSVFSDSMKSCFESNYGVEFVDNYDNADLEMYFEVSSNDNLRRESRKQAFKSEAYLNLKLVEINSKKIILDHVIAIKKASNYDFIERAGINALKDLSEEALNVFCD